MQLRIQCGNRTTRLIYDLNSHWEYNVRFFDYQGLYYGGLFFFNQTDTIFDCGNLISFLKSVFYSTDFIRDIELYDDNDQKVFSSKDLEFECTYIKCSQQLQKNQIDYDLNFGEGIVFYFKFNNNYMNNRSHEEGD